MEKIAAVFPTTLKMEEVWLSLLIYSYSVMYFSFPINLSKWSLFIMYYVYTECIIYLRVVIIIFCMYGNFIFLSLH